MSSLIDCLKLLQKGRNKLPDETVESMVKDFRSERRKLKKALRYTPETQKAMERAILDKHQGQINERLKQIQEQTTQGGEQHANQKTSQPETKPAAETAGRSSAPEPYTPEAAQSQAQAVEAAQRVPVRSEQALGVLPRGGGAVTADTIITRTPGDTLRSVDPKVESRWRDARRTKDSLLQRAKAAAVSIKNEFTRADPLLDPRTDGVWINAVHRFRTIPRHSQEMAANVIRGFTANFGKNKFEIFQRNVILRDLANDVSKGHYAGKELPFGYTPETLAADAAKFNDLAQLNPQVEQALQARTKFFDALKNDLVTNDLLPKEVLQNGDYFHRQIVDFLNLKDRFTSGTGSSDVRTHTKGFQRGRTHSVRDYNTNYLEAEYEVIGQSLGQLRTVEAVNQFKAADIKEQLKNEGAKTNTPWEKLVPDDYTTWQPKEGSMFYSALSIPDKIIDAVLNGTHELTKADLREVLALGKPREQWVIPKRLATTLDNLGPKQVEGAFSSIGVKLTNSWKAWILLNPARSIKYGLNNLSGDFDIAFAYSPKILKHAPKAASDMRQYVLKRGPINKEISEGIKEGVLSGGFSVAEVPDLNSHQFFRAITGQNANVMERAWQRNKDYHNWRENTLRLASWRYFRDKLDSAQNGERFYGASRKTEIDALYEAGRPNSEIAAKLGRELIGDYGNISHAGQWIRSHAIPFYSWMEVNAPRYVRIIKNAASEGEGNAGARVAGLIGKKAAMIPVKLGVKYAKTTALVAGMYTVVNLWNKTYFADEESELGDERRQLHLILGRNKDGTVRSFRMQGALSDALSWFGGADLPSDIQDVVQGKSTIKDKLIEGALAPAAKLISGVTPWIKTPTEALTKRSLFPDPFNPRPIRDPAETIAQLFSLEKPYRYFTDKPTRPFMNEIASLVTYTTDPGEAAYHMTRGLVGQWREKQGEEPSQIIPGKRANALFITKKALQIGDPNKAERWKQRYYAMGGTESGLKKSERAADPLGSLNATREEEFLKTLDPREKAVVERAKAWYQEIYKP